MPDKCSIMVEYTDKPKNSLKKIEKFQKFPPICRRKRYLKDPFFSHNLLRLIN